MSRSRRLLLGLLLAWSFLIRIWYGSVELTPERFWDERYGLANVGALLRGDSLRPANGYHPSLSYLPQAALLGAAEGLHDALGWPPSVFRPGGGFSATAYFLVRTSQAVFGVASLWLLHLLGRRLFGPEVGLLAPLVMAVVPWHIRQSAIFKPDVLLLMMILVVLLASLRSVRTGALRDYVVTGAAVGLALATKLNAAPVVVPVVVGAAAAFPRQRRRSLTGLAAAGAVALGVFLLLNPFLLLEPQIYREDFGRTLDDYARKGHETSRLDMPVHAVTSLLGSGFHGPVVGALGLAGFVWLTVMPARVWRRRVSGPARAREEWLQVAVFILGYVILYALATDNPSEHNWLPLVPGSSLGAAWLLVHAARRVATARPRLETPWVRATAATALVGVLAVPAQAYVYRSVVPGTAEAAAIFLTNRLNNYPLRLVASEIALPLPSLGRPRERPGVLEVDRLADLETGTLDRMDGEVFLEGRLTGPRRELYTARLGRVPEADRAVLRPRLFHLRGPALVAIAHPLRLERRLSHRGAGTAGEAGLLRSGALRDPPPGALLSALVSIAHPPGERPRVRLLLDGASIPCVPVFWRLRVLRCVTLRFRTEPGAEPLIRMEPPPDEEARSRMRVQRFHWSVPGEGS